MKYVNELQNRFFLIILCWISIFLITYLYKEILLFELLKPTTEKTIIMFNSFIFTNVTELFSVYIELAFFVSKQITVFYIFYHFFSFVSPGLYIYEHRLLKFFFKVILIFWIISILLYYYYLAPVIWNFFLSFQENLSKQQINIKFEAKISEYLSFFIEMYNTCNLQFQVFVVIILLLNYYSDNKNLIKQFRKFIYFFLLLISTIITPPDIFSQLIIYFILILFFEIMIVIQFLNSSFSLEAN